MKWKWVNSGKTGLYIMFYNPTDKNFSFGTKSVKSRCYITSSGHTFELDNEWLWDPLFKKGTVTDNTYNDLYHFGRYDNHEGLTPFKNDERANEEIKKIMNGQSSPITVHIVVPEHDQIMMKKDGVTPHIPEQEIWLSYSTASPYKYEPGNSTYTDEDSDNGAYDHNCVNL
ncbi:MAG: hypothetical protein PHV51_01255 [Methanosarcinaceae archaeon]|nr:hypothetical protein [Methanosarcinaceae archaeon]